MKVGILQVLYVLRKYSNSENALTANQILDYLEMEYGCVCTRQTVYRIIQKLNEQGVDVISDSNREGWYCVDRLFEESEVHWLCHSVVANKTIPSEQSHQLLDKLLSTQTVFFQSKFKNKLNLHNLEKKENKELFFNIELISEAIDRHYKISFQYTKYNLNKEIVLKSDKEYSLIPHFILFKNNRLYLIGYDEKYQNMTQYRVDRMINAKIIEEPHNMESIDPYEYAKSRLYMHGGEIEEFQFYGDEAVLDEVIDVFGSDITLQKIEDGFFATIETTEQEMIYFAFQFVEHVEVLAPKKTVKEIKKRLDRAVKKYKNRVDSKR